MPDSLKEQGIAVVAGATGYLGKHVVRSLNRSGWRVRALARSEDRLGEVRALCDEVVVAQATESQTLTGLFDGAQVAFSSIGIRHFRRRPTYEQVDYQANLNLVEEAERAGVRRFVFVSVLDGQHHRRLSALVDARERVVERLRASPMEAVILRPTGFFNDMGDFFKMAEKGKVWLIGSGETKINPVHGADLAQVAAEALACEAPASEIPVGGPEVFSQRQIAELAFETLDKPVRCGHVGPGTLRFLAGLVRPWSKNAAALMRMFSALGERDAVAPPFGTHRLASHFQRLAAQETA